MARAVVQLGLVPNGEDKNAVVENLMACLGAAPDGGLGMDEFKVGQ